MILFVRYISTLLVLLLLSHEAEMQKPIFTAAPSSPLLVVEGESVTLNWAYNLSGKTFRQVIFNTVPEDVFSIVQKFSADPTEIDPSYVGRITANITQTFSSITFLSVDRGDRKNYDLVVQSSGGTETSQLVELVVKYPPSQANISGDSVVVEGGHNITLTCTADGFPTPNITWTQVFDNGSDSNVLFTGQSGEPFVLLNNRNNSRTYRCTADNGIGSAVNNTADITVNFKPEQLQLVASETRVCLGDVVNFTCSADGKPAVHVYELFENGTLVANSSSPIVWSKTMSSGGLFIYKCVANNTVGSADTTTSVTVNVQSAITQSLNNITVIEGENQTLTCAVTGSPAPSVSWTAISTGSRSEGNTRELIYVSRNDSGEYKCETSNVCGNDTKSIFLTVHFVPENVQLMANKTRVCQDGVVSFTCSAVGNPVVHTYQLYENNMLIGSSSSGVWSRNMSSGGMFNYTCMANNTAGTANSTSSVSITVNVPPSIQPIQTEMINEGGNLTLYCNASGMPSPFVSWVKGGQRLINESKLELTNISRSQAGEYRCEASNECGHASETTNIDVKFKADNVRLVASDSTVCRGTVVNINCSADGNPAVHTYELFENETLVTSSNSPIVWSKNMTTGGKFIFKCVANNTLGTAMSTTSVAVNVPSSIQPIADETVTEGYNVTLYCNASGVPLPTVSWVKVSSGERFNGRELILTNISRNQGGMYRCEASNECGNASESANIDVQFKAGNVRLVASDSTVCLGTVVNINCSADGNPAVHIYELFENETLVTSSNSSIVWSKNMTTGGKFIFKCVANNTLGTAMSTTSVTVNVPSSIQPIADETVSEGDNVTLYCNASGTPPLSVSWIKVSSGERFNGRELMLTNISRNQGGIYRCEASNECSNASESSNIDVQFEPEDVRLSIFATGNKACVNDTVNITCTATAHPDVMSFHLFENDKLLRKSSQGTWSIPLSTSGEFTYKCMANNSLGTANSTTVRLDVGAPSSIQPIPDETVIEGGNVTLYCNASGVPPPSVSWSGYGGHGKELVFTYINRNKTGEYRCDASNRCGNASKTARVNVQYAPEITHISGSQTLNKGDQVTLNCTADGNPAPNITWTRLSDNSVVAFPLTITGKQDEGDYRCTANNGIGNLVTRNISITVHFPASIQPLDNKTVKKGDTITLFCNASGKPPPSVSWTYVDRGLKHDNETWVITDIDVNDLGEYRCDASNDYGNDSESMTVFYKGGKCEQECTSDKKSCQLFGKYVCLCKDRGRTGQNCEKEVTRANKIVVGVVFKNEEFKPEYEDLDNGETKKFTQKVEKACTEELTGIGLDECKVTSLRKGSVIADLELTFNQSVSQGDVDALLLEAIKDGNLGELEVSEIKVGGPIEGPTEGKEECNVFFEGEDCKKAKPALIALCAVAGVVVLALLIAIIACSMHKKKRSGQGSVSNGTYSQRHDPEGTHAGDLNGANDGRVEHGNLYGDVNRGYQHDGQQATPMVTFDPAHTRGIAINDSSSTKKAQPGEGHYADLGEFHQKEPSPTKPVTRPAAYQETPYAEITQFLKGPVKTDEADSESSQEEAAGAKRGDRLNDLNDEEENDVNNDTNVGILYPNLDRAGDGKEQNSEEFVVSI